eukprot:9408961-Alexandrium_andersonii.AAC.1
MPLVEQSGVWMGVAAWPTVEISAAAHLGSVSVQGQFDEPQGKELVAWHRECSTPRLHGADLLPKVAPSQDRDLGRWQS